MEFTITIDALTVTEALAAATQINRRKREAERQPEPLTFNDEEASDVVFQWLQNLILSDLQQADQVKSEVAVKARMDELNQRR